MVRRPDTMSSNNREILYIFLDKIRDKITASTADRIRLYDTIYLPIKNKIADAGVGKHDDGQLS